MENERTETGLVVDRITAEAIADAFAEDMRRRLHGRLNDKRRLHENRELRRLRKLAHAAGYEGSVGGWIYAHAPTYHAVCQGWRQFERIRGAKVGFVRIPFSPCMKHDDCRQLPMLGRACYFREHGLEG